MEKADKKAQILEAANELFGRQGFEGSSVREICQRAGVNLAMVNYYFGSKEGLFARMVEEKASFLRTRLQELVDNDKLSPLEKIDRMIEGYVERMFSHRRFSLTVMRELTKTQREPLHEEMSAIFLRNMELIGAIISEGIRRKVFRRVDIPLTISSLIGTIWALILNEHMVLKMCEGVDTKDPYGDEAYRRRVAKHLKQLMRSHLLTNQPK